MAKTYGRRRAPLQRRDFKARVQRAVYPRPQKSLYDADAWIKVQEVERIVVNGTTGPYASAVLCFRNDTPQIGYNRTFYGQPEFVPYVSLYQNYQLRGIQVEMALPEGQRILAANMFAGPANQVDPLGVAAPTDEALCGMPIVKQCALDGSMSKLYYNTHRAMAGSGVSEGQVTTAVAGGTQAQCVFLRVKTAFGVPENTIIGECTVTYFIRLMNRKSA
jgi:hypothetical protein